MIRSRNGASTARRRTLPRAHEIEIVVALDFRQAVLLDQLLDLRPALLAVGLFLAALLPALAHAPSPLRRLGSLRGLRRLCLRDALLLLRFALRLLGRLLLAESGGEQLLAQRHAHGSRSRTGNGANYGIARRAGQSPGSTQRQRCAQSSFSGFSSCLSAYSACCACAAVGERLRAENPQRPVRPRELRALAGGVHAKARGNVERDAGVGPPVGAGQQVQPPDFRGLASRHGPANNFARSAPSSARHLPISSAPSVNPPTRLRCSCST